MSNEWRKCEDDRRFIADAKNASYQMLLVMLKHYSHKNAPPWKRIVIERAISRIIKTS